MTFKKMLVPTDGSDYTRAAVEIAIDLARTMDAEVIALHAVDLSVLGGYVTGKATDSVFEVMDREGHRATGFVHELGKEHGVTVEERVVSGPPVKCILECSKECDLIVMGTLGRTGFSKIMVGSVAEKVVRFAKCPVLVVKSPEAE